MTKKRRRFGEPLKKVSVRSWAQEPARGAANVSERWTAKSQFFIVLTT
jgi:hypothetical protein